MQLRVHFLCTIFFSFVDSILLPARVAPGVSSLGVVVLREALSCEAVRLQTESDLTLDSNKHCNVVNSLVLEIL